MVQTVQEESAMAKTAGGRGCTHSGCGVEFFGSGFEFGLLGSHHLLPASLFFSSQLRRAKSESWEQQFLFFLPHWQFRLFRLFPKSCTAARTCETNS